MTGLSVLTPEPKNNALVRTPGLAMLDAIKQLVPDAVSSLFSPTPHRPFSG